MTLVEAVNNIGFGFAIARYDWYRNQLMVIVEDRDEHGAVITSLDKELLIKDQNGRVKKYTP